MWHFSRADDARAGESVHDRLLTGKYRRKHDTDRFLLFKQLLNSVEKRCSFTCFIHFKTLCNLLWIWTARTTNVFLWNYLWRFWIVWHFPGFRFDNVPAVLKINSLPNTNVFMLLVRKKTNKPKHITVLLLPLPWPQKLIFMHFTCISCAVTGTFIVLTTKTLEKKCIFTTSKMLWKTCADGLTSTDTFQWVEEGHQEVHEDCQVKGDAAPEGHVSGTPVQDGLGWRTQSIWANYKRLLSNSRSLENLMLY